jgi:hypothetical protein
MVTLSTRDVPARGNGKTTGGSQTATCSCRRAERRAKEIISAGLRIIRTRFSIPAGELPILAPGDLDRYLLFLLGGPNRSPTPFPRRQSGWTDGFPNLLRLGRVERWMMAQSCASLKRSLIPLPCPVHPPPSAREKWFGRQCSESPSSSSAEYLDFARKVTRRVFPFGWDRHLYPSFCHSFCPRDSGREQRGLTASQFWSASSRWLEFQNAVLRGHVGIRKGFKMRYKEVPTVGKVRPMGIPSIDWDYLGPLHKSIYEHLCSTDWLMCGPPTSSRIGSTCVNEWQTSVDLVSATDGLRIDVAESILGVLLAKSEVIPGFIRLMAHESLRPVIDGREVTQGQMMGTYLSFPLLCLQSYIAARWAARFDDQARFLVNGDDVLISARRVVAREDYPEGFCLNDRKTVRAQNVAELNSTTFLRVGQRWKEVRHLRRGGFDSRYLSGHVHAAAVCSAAGPAWVTAYFRSRTGYRWRLLPSELGFSLTNRAAWDREMLLQRTHHARIPRPELPAHRYRFVDRSEITEDEQIAFRIDLFEGGRETQRKHRGVLDNFLVLKRSWTPHVMRPRGTTFSGRRFRDKLTFNLRVIRGEEAASKKRELAFVPLSYEGRPSISEIKRNADGEFWLPDWWE